MIHHRLSWKALRMGFLSAALCCGVLLHAQNPEPLEEVMPPNPQVMDDFTQRSIVTEKQTIPYAPIREADIMWEKRIWRVIDTREKMNLPFVAPESALFNVLKDAAMNNDLQIFEDDKFSKRLTASSLQDMLYKQDTITKFDPVTFEEQIEVVNNEINWEDIKRFRIKEAWFFDENTSTLKVRILGIAPLREVYNESGDFLYEQPMFWVHYASSREILARNKCITNQGNMAAATTWEDMFEMRYFSALPVKENNVRDLRLQDMYAGLELLQKADQIDDELFNFEHDLWSW